MIFNYFAISMVIFLAFLDSLSLSLSRSYSMDYFVRSVYAHNLRYLIDANKNATAS